MDSKIDNVTSVLVAEQKTNAQFDWQEKSSIYERKYFPTIGII